MKNYLINSVTELVSQTVGAKLTDFERGRQNILKENLL